MLPLCFRCTSVSSPFRNYRINGGRAKDQRRMKGGRREAEGKQKGREIPNNKHLDVCHMEIVRLGSPSYVSSSLWLIKLKQVVELTLKINFLKRVLAWWLEISETEKWNNFAEILGLCENEEKDENDRRRKGEQYWKTEKLLAQTTNILFPDCCINPHNCCISYSSQLKSVK